MAEADLRIAYAAPVFETTEYGQAARLVIRAMHQAGVHVTVANTAVRAPEVTDCLVESLLGVDEAADFHILHGIPSHWARADFARRGVIALTNWETDVVPRRWRNPLACAMDVWLPSHFNVGVFASGLGRMPFRLPHPLAEATPPARLALHGVSEHDFVFYTILPWQEHKNPTGTIEAFLRAFPRPCDAVLVLKCDHQAAAAASLAAARQRTGGRGRVVIAAAAWNAAQTSALQQRGDCYVSLHRGEGWGYQLFEAAARGSLVVATGYSGPLDYLDPESHWLVGYRIVPVRQRHDDYHPGMRWAEPDLDHAAEGMCWVYRNRSAARERAAATGVKLQHQFALDRIGASAKARLLALRAGGPRAKAQERARSGSADARAVDRLDAHFAIIGTHAGAADTVHLAFDVSDLIVYFRNARVPTGIQRVQIELITGTIRALPTCWSLKIACLTRTTRTWIEIPAPLFTRICKLAVACADPHATDWQRVRKELGMHLEQAHHLVFRPGTYLINLGTSWWLQTYFLNVCAAKARYGIRYVPYIHDCVPVMAPQYCVEGVRRNFISWAMDVFHHADHILVNSKATSDDVKRVAQSFGHTIDEPGIIKLDADFSAPDAHLHTESDTFASTALFRTNNLRPGNYVLFVSTIEPRKNHVMAFSAWLSLVKKYGADRVPRLVCVGNRGWLNNAIYAKHNDDPILIQKIAMLSAASDPDLRCLYRNCLFTLYPSSYEGWGLPVTESLCFGKAPVLANGSSLPEAGGEFGVYFDLGSESDLLQVLERMMFDTEYRASRERLILDRFRPRTWAEIAEQVISLVRDWACTDPPRDRAE
jgi:glycosyltransferase involved in cell wall biosynthesis